MIVKKECMVCGENIGKFRCMSCGRIICKNCYDAKRRRCISCD